MNLAVANKLNCMCDELITIISLLDKIQSRTGRRFDADSNKTQEKVVSKNLPRQRTLIKRH